MKLSKKDIVVVIPVYRSTCSKAEEQSILQGKKILQDYQTVLVCPDSMDVSNYLSINSDLKIERFPDTCFESIAAYNQLMMSPMFYRRFLANQYMLIYQTDAWVFKDELLEWCEKGYDYIGAPWVRIPPPNKKVIFNLSKFLLGKVGNGGFCIRNVQKFYRSAIFYRPLSWLFPKNEDFFWCLMMPRLNPFFSIPSAAVALRFAFELDPSDCYKKTGGQLPFGCHAWEKYEPEFWSAFIPQATPD